MNDQQAQMRYSGGALPNIFAPMVDPLPNVIMNGGTPGRPISAPSRPSSVTTGSMMMDYNSGTAYGLNSPMNNFPSGGSVILTPPLSRPTSFNMGVMSSGGAQVPGMNVGGLNTMGMNNLSMNNMGLGINNLNNMSMATLHMNNMNTSLSPMMQPQALLAPGMTGMAPMMMSPAGISPLPSVSGLSTMGGVGLSPYGNAPSGLLPLTPSNLLTPNQMFNPMMGNPNFSSHVSGGQLTYMSPVGGPPIPSTDPALDAALRQSMVVSTPSWMVDHSYQAAREEAMKKENDNMLEKAIRQSLDEINLHRLRQDEIERSNRVLQQSNDRALEEAIRASLHDYSHEDVKRHRSKDAIEQANEDALQRAILQSIKDSTTSASQSVTNATSSMGGITAQCTVTITRTFAGIQDTSVIGNGNAPSSRASLGGNVVSSNNANKTGSQPYRPGPFPPEPPPEIPYYQVQFQQTLQQRGQEMNQESSYNSGGENYDGGYYQQDNTGQPNQYNNNPPNSRAQMMTGMMMRRSADDVPQSYQGNIPVQQSENGYQRSLYQSYGQNGSKDEDDYDEYMQSASYENHSPALFRQQPSSQFISVGAGQSRNGGGMNNNNNDSETIVSSSSSGVGIGRNTAAQVSSLYLNNPDLVEQDMQQRYQRQYQQYLHQQLANAEMANQRLASSSQDAYDQIHQHHGQQLQPRQAGQPGSREYPKSSHQPHPDASEDHFKNVSSNLSANGSTGVSGTSAARRLSQAQSFMGNPLLQSRHSAVAQQLQYHYDTAVNAGASNISPVVPASFHQLQKPCSFHVPRASFHQYVGDNSDGHLQQTLDGHEVDPSMEANQNYHPHCGHHTLGIHHEMPHRLSTSGMVVDDFGVSITVDEKYHPHLNQLKATLSQTQLSLSSESEDEEYLRPKGTGNENSLNNSYVNMSHTQQQASPVVPVFPTQTAPANASGRTMKKTFSAPKMVDHDDHSRSSGAPVNVNGTPAGARGSRPSV
jgi:hypothetical protein